jgi:hypothetical protein
MDGSYTTGGAGRCNKRKVWKTGRRTNYRLDMMFKIYEYEREQKTRPSPPPFDDNRVIMKQASIANDMHD